MPTLSTEPGTPRSRRYLLGIIAVFATSCALLGYLFTPSLPAGDGAAYLDQVAAGDLGRRTLHLGYLVQLLPLQRLLGDSGAPLLSAVWGASVPLALAWGSAALLPPGRPRALALGAPIVLLGAQAFWHESLFPEVYGPAAAALAWSAALRLQGRTPWAAVLAGVAVATHPGSVAWLPAVTWLGPRRPVSHHAGFLAAAMAIPALFALAAPADYLAGDRGLLAVLSSPDPWHALQRAYRATAGAYPLTGAVLLAALPDRRIRARVGGPLILGLALAMALDWRDDVPAYHPVIVLLPLLAGPALAQILRVVGSPRIPLAALALLAAAQIGEATSAHDRARRVADREVAVLRELALDESPPRPHGTYGEVARYRHYVGSGTDPHHVQLPPGRPFAPGTCQDQRPRALETARIFACPRPPQIAP